MKVALLCLYLVLLTANGLKLHKIKQFQNKNPRIIGGRPINSDEFPFFAQLERIVRINTTYNESMPCGSSLIHPMWILSAAHCFAEVEEIQPPLYPPFVKVYMNTVERYSRNASINLLSAVIIHPYHVLNITSNDTVLQCLNDVALGRLKIPFELSRHIQVITLPSPHQPRCRMGYIIGIGKRRFFPHQFGHYVYTTSTQTKERATLGNPSLIPPSDTLFFAEVHMERKGYPFSGDSGGPFFCKIKGVTVQFGIITQSDNDTRRRTVQTAFESVDKHMGFIKEYVPDVKIMKSVSNRKCVDCRSGKLRHNGAFKQYLNRYTLLIVLSSVSAFGDICLNNWIL